MRVATFNILHGRSPSDDLVDVERFVAAIRSLDADVLALQEVDRDQPRSHAADFTAVAAEAMNAVDHRFVAALAGTPGATWMAATGLEQPGSAAYGIALLSRYPVLSWQVLRLPHIPFHFPFRVSEPGRWIIASEEPRVCVVARLETPAGPLAVANTHLSFVPGWNEFQLRRIRRACAAIPGNLLIVGDLNMELGRARAASRMRPLVTGQATFPADEPTRQLDHVLARGDALHAAAAATLRADVSDHRALIVEIADLTEPANLTAPAT